MSEATGLAIKPPVNFSKDILLLYYYWAETYIYYELKNLFIYNENSLSSVL